ncbi:MAG: efflux RND transporter periplasmic adaptor subunit [Rubrivivax sp.]|nr:efflux RND transporter periplasmic adaptor subunit [Rubrivivax sp.]
MPGAQGPQGAASAPPVSVSVVRAVRRDVAVQVEATGTVSALASIDIKPQIASVVTAVHVKEGQFVARGQPLFTLDGRADAANLARAEAQLLKDQATLADAQRQLARSQDLLSKGFVSQGAVDTAQANVEAQRAAIAADRAAIEAARVAVSYSRIAAPSNGRVGQINVYPGSSVSPSGPALVTVTQLDPIAVSFNLPQRNLPDALVALAAARSAPAKAAPAAATKAASAPAGAPGAAASSASASASASAAAAAQAAAAAAPGAVLAVLPEGRGTRIGRLDFVDNLVEAASGTVKVKAVFDNRDQALWPGAYVNVQVALQSLPGAVLVPQASVVQGARGTAVFVVDAEGVAAMRPVRVLQALGTEAAVSGVRPGEKIVLDGRQNVRPGARVIERAPDGPPRTPGAPGAPGGPGGRGASASGGARASSSAAAGPGTPGSAAAAAAAATPARNGGAP